MSEDNNYYGTGDQKVHKAMKHFGDLTDQARYLLSHRFSCSHALGEG